MVTIYANLIKARIKTLDQVPEKIRAAVKSRLISEGVIADDTETTSTTA